MFEPKDVLIDGYTFLVDRAESVDGADGLYHRDTRYLSHLELSLDAVSLVHIGTDYPSPSRQRLYYADASSAVNELSESASQKHTDVILVREQHVSEGDGLTEQITLQNHAPTGDSLRLRVRFGVDFADLFEVRGIDSGINRDIERLIDDDHVRYRYTYETAADEHRVEETTVAFAPSPDALTAGEAQFDLDLGSQATRRLELTIRPTATLCSPEADPVPQSPVPETGDPAYDQTFKQAAADLAALTTRTKYGLVPLAGVPWFATVFGRDALITAYQLLPFVPELAEGTLRYLAAHQGIERNEVREEEPGKILHEHRHGELAAKKLVPHTPYYGSIDATPLWLVLLDETVRWTGNEALLTTLRPHIDAAFDWLDRAIDRFGDDPFLYYAANRDQGLHHKAWRDTEASIQFTDGEHAEAPLASVEVQGYVYDSFRRGARLLTASGDVDRAKVLRCRAEHLVERFDETFWMPECRYYATAKTANGRLVDSLASNVGHCLWSGILPDNRASDVVNWLCGPELNSGWGIRTMSTADAGYSPVSYHAGGVWPHDASIIALGLTKYGFGDAAESLTVDVLDATTHFDRNRVPELYCGFDDEVQPQKYAAACEPQAWGTGAPYGLLRAIFDLTSGDGTRTEVGRYPDAFDPMAAASILDDRFSVDLD